MDLVEYSEEVFTRRRSEVSAICTSVGFKTNQIVFVPISGFLGDCLVEPSERLPWYAGPALVELLDQLQVPPRASTKPFRMPVQETFKIFGVGTVVCGNIVSGTVNVGDQMYIGGTTDTTAYTVSSIQVNNRDVKTATAGDDVGIALRNCSVRNVARGHVICGLGDGRPGTSDQHGSGSTATAGGKIDGCAEFTATLMMLKSGKTVKLKEGYQCTIEAHSAHVPVRVTKILNKQHRQTGMVTEENPESLCSGEKGDVLLTPLKSDLVLTKFTECAPLGRFAIRNCHVTLALGIVKDIKYGKLGAGRNRQLFK
eukprot:GFYU01007275.1.p1 GENE.GFYU01007275.1~~GFYU01007275.1.p1  ORF type:complete len:341 (-),score=91.00 GFYU01007275.1:91-1026(-)